MMSYSDYKIFTRAKQQENIYVHYYHYIYINSNKFESKPTKQMEENSFSVTIIVNKLDNRNDTNIAEIRSIAAEMKYLTSSSLALQKVCLARM